jgi:hypothetical protein
MREAEPFGFFIGRAGETIDLVQWSKRINAPLREVRHGISELESKHVFSRDVLGRIFSRRQLREVAKSLDAFENGKMGGNPALLSAEDLNQGVKGEVKPLDKAGVKPVRGGLDTRLLDTSSDSLRSSALAFGSWPQKMDRLRALALIFIAEFANCRDATKAEKYVGAYTGYLAAIRGRGLSIEQAWQACTDARDACGGRPLFAGSVRTAINFLPTRETPNSDTAGESPSARYRRVQGL